MPIKTRTTEFQTFVVSHVFHNDSINFTDMLRAKKYVNRFWVKSAFSKALHKRYKAEGIVIKIVIPSPTTALNLPQEHAQQVMSEINSVTRD